MIEIKKNTTSLVKILFISISIAFGIMTIVGSGGDGGGSSSTASSDTPVSNGSGIPNNPTRTAEVLYTNPYPTHLKIKNDYLYWSEESVTPLNRISLNGGNTEPLANKIGVPVSIVKKGQYIYWIDVQDGSDYGCSGHRAIMILNKTSLDGSVTEKLAEGPNCYNTSTSKDLFIDDEYVYWISSGITPSGPPEYLINKVPISGGISNTLHATSGKILAFNGDDTNLYWEEESFDTLGKTEIKKMSKSGGNTFVLWSTDFYQLSGGLAVGNAELYFSIFFGAGYYDIRKLSASGDNISTLATVDNSRTDPYGTWRVIDIVVDSTDLYWVDFNSLRSVSLISGDSKTLAAGLSKPISIKTDTDKIYWLEEDSGLSWSSGIIKSLSKVDSTNVIMADKLNRPNCLLVDNNSLYWTEGGDFFTETDGLSRIAQMPITGGSVNTFITGINKNNPSFALDDTKIYITDGYTIKTVPQDGGKLDILTWSPVRTDIQWWNPQDELVGNIVTDGIFLYWTSDNATIYEMSIDGGPVTELAITNPQTGNPYGLRFYDNFLYWKVDNKINEVSTQGGNVSSLVTDSSTGSASFTIDAVNIYHVNDDRGVIYKVPINGGANSSLAYCNSFDRSSITVDDDYLYWINQTQFKKISLAGGNATSIMNINPLSGRSGIIVDDTSIYWGVDSGEIWRVTPK